MERHRTQSGTLPKGVLDPEEARKHFTLAHVAPSPGVSFFVERYWSVRWNLPEGTSYTQEILSYPSVHLVFERYMTRIYGVVTGTFSRHLEGSAHVLGVKFQPGAFYPFFRAPVSSISNKTIGPDQVFQTDMEQVERNVLDAGSPEAMAAIAESFLSHHLPKPDDRIALINRIVEVTAADRSIVRVDQLSERSGMSTRALQRLFNTWVGVSPKWIIMRFRLHEAAGALAKEGSPEWTDLAAELGYFDQAHFINDFRSIVGVSPAKYADRAP